LVRKHVYMTALKKLILSLGKFTYLLGSPPAMVPPRPRTYTGGRSAVVR